MITQHKILRVPPIFQENLTIISNQLHGIFKEDLAAFLHFEDFYEDFCWSISECYSAISQQKMIYATKIIEYFYSKWIHTSLFPEHTNTLISAAVASGFTSLIMVHLSVQLAYITHYSMCAAAGFVMLFIGVGFKVTTPEWISIGLLSHGQFKCNIFKTHALQKKGHRLFK